VDKRQCAARAATALTADYLVVDKDQRSSL
jgi:hypothetical protein